MDVSIIIINYKTKDITKQCLESVFASKGTVSYEVIVVDNNSGDGSIEAIEKAYPQAKIIKSPENGGFAKGNNLGVNNAKGKYVWLLNSDTIIEPDTLQKLFETAEKNRSYIASCKLVNPDKTLQPQGGALPTPLNITAWMLNLDISLVNKYIPPYQERRATQYTKTSPSGIRNQSLKFGWLGGTALLIRRDLYVVMGGLDENIFMYGEDVEFCLRAALADFSVDYFSEPQLVHLGSASGSSERAVVGEFAGLKYIFKKHKSSIEYNWLRIMLKVGALLRIILYTLKGNRKQRTTYAKAFTMA